MARFSQDRNGSLPQVVTGRRLCSRPAGRLELAQGLRLDAFTTLPFVRLVFLSRYELRRVREQDEVDDSRRPSTFTVNAPDRDWRRRTRYRVLLAARNGRDRDLELVGVASVTTRGVFHSEERAVLEVGPWLLFEEPVQMRELLQGIAPRYESHLRRVVDLEESRRLPPVTSEATTERLRRLVPAFDGMWESLPEPAAPERLLRPTAELPLVDAGQTALRLFTRKWGEIEPSREDAPPTETAARVELLARASENDFITDDATRFLDWELNGASFGGWFEFHEGGRQLLVKNINVSMPEARTGADLVYVSPSPASVVVVQYKLLERLATTDELIFRPDGRLVDQVDRMCRLSSTKEQVAHHTDVRLRDSMAFVKFVDPTEQRTTSARNVRLTGHYHPVDYAAQMLEMPASGPRGGVVHRISDWRSIDGQTFARLVRDRWVGSRGDVTAELFEILGLSFVRGPMVLAIDEPART